jgi:hypothetical protein
VPSRRDSMSSEHTGLETHARPARDAPTTAVTARFAL